MEEFYINADGIKLHAKLDKPKGVSTCPLLILLHGLTGHMEERHIVAVAHAANEVGYAVLRVELYGHGKSDGDFCNHTLYKWINNALAVIDYAKGLDWATHLCMAGHSQGGYTTMLVAGMRHDDLRAILPLSPAIVIEDGARSGTLLGMHFDPKHIPNQIFLGDPDLAERDPEFAKRYTICGDYLRVAQTLHVHEAINRFAGPVLLVHGDADESVPVHYSIDAAERYANARLVIVEGDSHCYDFHLDKVTAAVKDFLVEQRI